MTKYPEFIIQLNKTRGSYVHGGAGNATAYSGNMKDMKVIGIRSQHEFGKGNPASQPGNPLWWNDWIGKWGESSGHCPTRLKERFPHRLPE